MAERYLRARDPEAARQLLALHLPALAEVAVDWGACGCLRVTLLAVETARRIAGNLAKSLRSRESMAAFLGHERDIDIEGRAMAEGRIVELALLCAELMTDSAASDAAWALPDHTRAIQEVQAYHKMVRMRTPDIVAVFQIHLESFGLPQYDLEHVYEAPKKVKVGCW